MVDSHALSKLTNSWKSMWFLELSQEVGYCSMTCKDYDDEVPQLPLHSEGNM